MTVTMPTLGIAWDTIASGITDFLAVGLITSAIVFVLVLRLSPAIVRTIKSMVRR